MSARPRYRFGSRAAIFLAPCLGACWLHELDTPLREFPPVLDSTPDTLRLERRYPDTVVASLAARDPNGDPVTLAAGSWPGAWRWSAAEGRMALYASGDSLGQTQGILVLQDPSGLQSRVPYVFRTFLRADMADFPGDARFFRLDTSSAVPVFGTGRPGERQISLPNAPAGSSVATLRSRFRLAGDFAVEVGLRPGTYWQDAGDVEIALEDSSGILVGLKFEDTGTGHGVRLQTWAGGLEVLPVSSFSPGAIRLERHGERLRIECPSLEPDYGAGDVFDFTCPPSSNPPGIVALVLRFGEPGSGANWYFGPINVVEGALLAVPDP